MSVSDHWPYKNFFFTCLARQNTGWDNIYPNHIFFFLRKKDKFLETLLTKYFLRKKIIFSLLNCLAPIKVNESQILKWWRNHLGKNEPRLSTKFSLANFRPLPFVQEILNRKLLLQEDRYVKILEHVWFYMCRTVALYG